MTPTRPEAVVREPGAAADRRRKPAPPHRYAHVAPVQPDQPVAGYYRIRLAKGAAWSPVRIWHGPPFDPVTRQVLDRSHHWRAELNGEQVDVAWVWPSCAGERITRAEYDFMAADAAWCREHAPSDPKANPRQPIDIRSLELPF